MTIFEKYADNAYNFETNIAVRLLNSLLFNFKKFILDKHIEKRKQFTVVTIIF